MWEFELKFLLLGLKFGEKYSFHFCSLGELILSVSFVYVFIHNAYD